ncbi:MAG: T9SS type A sorting domain-containing protein [Bacteroidota bacterium]
MVKNVLFISLLWTASLQAQMLPFQPSNSVPVVDFTQTAFESPWAGGMNNPQFSETDLNQDGKKDLVVFDRADNTFTTFLNTGTEGNISYPHTPKYQDAFKDCDCNGWALLRDYNCDGLEDVFCGTLSANIQVYKQVQVSEDSITFVPEIDFLRTDIREQFFLYSNDIDIPSIVDVDWDGDLDILSFGVAGNYIEWHRNLAVENENRCDTMILERDSRCWGHFFEGEFDNTAFLNDTLNCELGDYDPSREILHVGSTTTLLDLNADSLYDALIGDITFNSVYALYNGGRKDYGYMTSVESNFPSAGNPINVYAFPAIYHLDINNDEKKDLIVAPNSLVSEDKVGVQVYVNSSQDSLPKFTSPIKGLFQVDQVEVGSRSYPVLIDYNGDGLKDLLITNFSTTSNEPSGVVSEPLSQLYLNIGSGAEALFKQVSEDVLLLRSNYPDVLGAGIAAGDVDGDEKEDILFGTADGQLWFFKNTTLDPNSPQFQLVDQNYYNISTDAYCAPALHDADDDGDLDLFIGNRRGFIAYYRNLSTSTQPDFVWQTDEWGDIKINDEVGGLFSDGYAQPTFYDIDEDEEPELITGGITGKVSVYEGVVDAAGENATTATLSFSEDLLEDRWMDFSSPTLGILDNTNTPVIISGNQRGGLLLFRTQEVLSTSTKKLVANLQAKVFPNPATDQLSIQLSANDVEETELNLFSLIGENILKGRFKGNTHTLTLPELPTGIYLLRLRSGDSFMSKKIYIQR